MRGDRFEQSGQNSWAKIFVWAIGLIMLILLVRFISGGSDASLDTAAVSLKLTDTNSSAQIIDTDNSQKDVNANTPLVALDQIEIKNGTAQVLFLSNAKNSLNLNTGTKLRYLGQGTDGKTQLRLENKDLWIQADTGDMTIDLIGLTISPTSTTVMNVSKNDLFTTITVLQGSANIMLGSESQEITAGKQLNYSTLRTLTAEDIKSRIAPINPETLTSEWMSLNGASAYINSNTSTTTPLTGGDSTLATAGAAGGLILFESPIDESTVETKTITISGRILSASVARVIINNTAATVDPVKQTFTLANVPLNTKENNLVYRTYDVAGKILSKWLITVYTSTPGTWATTSTTTAAGLAAGDNYKIDNRFRVIAPSSDFYETRESKVKIEWRVTPGVAHHITINGFKLNSFTTNVGTWYYFANQQFGNLEEGINTYTIRYFDASDVEIYKQLFIIKKLPATTTQKPTTVAPTPTPTVTPKPQKEIIPSTALSDG